MHIVFIINTERPGNVGCEIIGIVNITFECEKNKHILLLNFQNKMKIFKDP